MSAVVETEPPVEYPWIAGERDQSQQADQFPVINPTTGATNAYIVSTTEQQLTAAVEAAHEAQACWLALAPSDRGNLLSQWGKLIAAHAREVAVLDTLDMGRAISESIDQVAGSPRAIDYWAGMADKVGGEFRPVLPGHLSYTKREPLGVIGVILPWNSPASQFALRVAVTLACGNGAVVKPSEYAPRSSLFLAELAAQAGIPRGLISVVTGDGRLGAALSAHPRIGGVSFTGSVATGRQVSVAAAAGFKRVVLEMGGKSPNIVFADADLNQALLGSLWGVFGNAGQVCNAGTRLIVQRSIADDFVEGLRQMALRVRVGDPMDETTQIGPIVCQRQYDRVTDYLAVGRSEAKLIVGGGRPASLPGDVGLFVEPTIFTGVEPTARIAQEEIFGPVLSVLTFDDDDEALALANAVEYGLAANVWTSDLSRMVRFAEHIEAGTVWGNSARVLHPALPTGGLKDSGLGTNTGDAAIEGMTRLRRVSIRVDMSAPAPGWRDV